MIKLFVIDERKATENKDLMKEIKKYCWYADRGNIERIDVIVTDWDNVYMRILLKENEFKKLSDTYINIDRERWCYIGWTKFVVHDIYHTLQRYNSTICKVA